MGCEPWKTIPDGWIRIILNTLGSLSFSAMTALYGSLENVFDVEARSETGGL